MVRKSLAATVLLLGLAAAPAFAQSQATPGPKPEESEAARTMAQNRRALIGGQPAQGVGQSLPQGAATGVKPGKAGSSPFAGKAVTLADGQDAGRPR